MGKIKILKAVVVVCSKKKMIFMTQFYDLTHTRGAVFNFLVGRGLGWRESEERSNLLNNVTDACECGCRAEA